MQYSSIELRLSPSVRGTPSAWMTCCTCVCVCVMEIKERRLGLLREGEEERVMRDWVKLGSDLPAVAGLNSATSYQPPSTSQAKKMYTHTSCMCVHSVCARMHDAVHALAATQRTHKGYACTQPKRLVPILETRLYQQVVLLERMKRHRWIHCGHPNSSSALFSSHNTASA